MSDYQALVRIAGVTSNIPNADSLLAGAGIKGNTGALSVGAGGATTLAGTTTTATNAIYANGGVDRSAAATLSLGATNANKVEISKIGVLTQVLGDFQVDGVTTFVGNVTAQSDATFEGNTVIGNAATDTLSIVASVINNLHFLKEANHTIDVNQSTTVGVAGGNITLTSGRGANASGGTPGADAGTTTVSGNQGGDGTGALAAGAGGVLALVSGGGGASGGGAGGSSGNITIDAGTPTGSGVAGDFSVGGTRKPTTVNIFADTGGMNITAAGAGVITTANAGLTIGTTDANTLTAKTNNVSRLIFSSAGLITVQAGATLGTTGSGTINLPLNGSSTFQIEGVAVATTNTATAFNTVTGGPASNADAYHTHSGLGTSTSVQFTRTAGEAVAVGAPVAMSNVAGVSKALNADANGTGTRPNVNAFAVTSAAGDGSSFTVETCGTLTIPDAIWDATPAVGDTGKPVYLSENVGKITLTAPSTSGSTQVRVGWVELGGAAANANKIDISFGEPVVL